MGSPGNKCWDVEVQEGFLRVKQWVMDVKGKRWWEQDWAGRTRTVLQIWEVLSPGAQDACWGGTGVGGGPGLEPAGRPGHSCHTRALAGAPAVEGPGGLVARSLWAQGALSVADWKVLFWREIWASHLHGCQMCDWSTNWHSVCFNNCIWEQFTPVELVCTFYAFKIKRRGLPLWSQYGSVPADVAGPTVQVRLRSGACPHLPPLHMYVAFGLACFVIEGPSVLFVMRYFIQLRVIFMMVPTSGHPFIK